MADGVKIFNQDTWKMLLQGDQGKQFLCDNASEVMGFYLSQLSSENYQVREAGCHAL